MNRPARWSTLTLAVLCVLALFWNLGARGLNEPDEGRCASIAREMQAGGDLLTPRLYDRAHMNKPPLLYWLMGASYRCFGVHEWAARLPAALAALGTLLLTWRMGRRMFDEETARAATLVLLSCPLFAVMSRIVDYNMVLTFFVTLCMWSFLAWMQDGKPCFLWTGYLSAGLAFLTKGPPGPVILALALLSYALRRPPPLPWRAPRGWGPAMCGLAAGLSWYLLAAHRHPELWDFFLHRELFQRAFTTHHDRQESIFYYAAILPVGLLPWLPVVGAALRRVGRDWRADYAARLLGGWALWPLLLFSLLPSKTPTYVLPLLPAFALLAGRELANGARHGYGLLGLRAFVCGTALLAPPATLLAGRILYGWEIAWPAALLWPSVLIGVLAFASFLARPAWRTFSLAALVVASLHAVHALVAANETRLGPQSTVRPLAAAIHAAAPSGTPVALLARHPRGLSFYGVTNLITPSYKFTTVLHADRERLQGRSFDEPAPIFRAFDRTNRLLLVTSPQVVTQLQATARNQPVVLYRDARYVLISN